MIRPERLLYNRQRELVQRLCLCVLALGSVEFGQVVQARGDSRIIRAERLLVNRQRALIKRLGLRVLALGSVQLGQVVRLSATAG